jgi:deoxyribodipyrimidine photo-lyase
MEKAIWWIRRDLRLADNQTMAEALEQAREVIPLFILDPVLINSQKSSEKRLAFLYNGLKQMDADLSKAGSHLMIRRGNPLEVLSQLSTELAIKGIFAEADFSPYARRRDARVAEALPLNLISSPSFRHPAEVLKKDGSPYTVFTPYMRAWKKLALPGRRELIPGPEKIQTPADIASEPFPEPDIGTRDMYFIPGEAEANRRLEIFTEGNEGGIFRYADLRNRMDVDGTAGLSPYLRFGMVSARQAVVAAREAAQLAANIVGETGADTWLNELIWREFYQAMLNHFPEVAKHSFRSELRPIRWRNDPDDFSDWKNGATGYPVVDAGMRQLTAMGWMHNRARMITASFLVKDLLIDWRMGEAYFMSQLVDGDPAANNGGWQWIAGTGADAAPYFRIFNPILQSQKFDPQGIYIRKWVPELQGVPDEYIHQPWQMPVTVQVNSSCILGKNYPHPIVDHKKQRELTLTMYGRR